MNVWGLTKKILSISMLALPLTMTATLTGCLTEDDPDDDPPAAVDSVQTKSVEVGAQGNNDLGSFIDLDTYAVLKQDPAEAASATVDLIFAYSGSASSSAVYSPDAAKAGIDGGPGLDIAQNLSTANKSELRTIDVAKFDAVTTKAGLDSLYNSGTVAANGRLLVSNNFAFGAKTAGGKIVGMKITAVTTGTTGKATISAKAKW